MLRTENSTNTRTFPSKIALVRVDNLVGEITVVIGIHAIGY